MLESGRFREREQRGRAVMPSSGNLWIPAADPAATFSGRRVLLLFFSGFGAELVAIFISMNQM